MQTIWKHIEGVDSHYEVSNTGLVRTIGSRRYKTGAILKTHTPKGRYPFNILMSNGIKKMVRVHRAVAVAFLDNIDGKTQVNHKDCNKSNNRVDNLEWVTPKENMAHGQKNNLFPTHKIKHGTVNEYINYGCRCAICKAAHRTYYVPRTRAWRESKKVVN